MTNVHFPANQHDPLLSPVHAHGHIPCELDPPLSLSRSRKPSFRRLSAFLHPHLQADRVHDRPNVLRKSSLPPHVLPGLRIERVVSLEDDLLNGAHEAPSRERKRGWSLFHRRSSEGRLSAPVAPLLLSHGLDLNWQTSPPSPAACSRLSTVSSRSSTASSISSICDGPHTPPHRYADLSETCHSSTPSPHAAEPLPLRLPSPLFPALLAVQLDSPSDLAEAKPRCLSSPPPPPKPSRAAPPVPMSETRMVGPLQLAEDEDGEEVDAEAPAWGFGLELLQAHEEKDETSELDEKGSVVELSIEATEEDGSHRQFASPADVTDGVRMQAGGALDIATEDDREVVPWSLGIFDLFPVPSALLLVSPQRAASFEPATVPLPTPTLEEAAELVELPVHPPPSALALAILPDSTPRLPARSPVDGDDPPNPSIATLDLNPLPSTMSQFDPATVTNIAPVPLLYAAEDGSEELSQGDAQELAVSAADGVGGEDTEASEGLFPGVPLEQQRAVAALVALLW